MVTAAALVPAAGVTPRVRVPLLAVVSLAPSVMALALMSPEVTMW